MSAAPNFTFTVPAVQVRWMLSGPAGAHIDALIAGLIGAGAVIEPISAGVRYRIHGDPYMLDSLASGLAAVEGFSLALEVAPVGQINIATTLAPRLYQRSITVHGVGPAYSFIARAVDRSLTVATIGMNRWSVTGPTSALMDWVAEVDQRTPAEVLAAFRISPEDVAAEDAQAPMAVHVVSLPDRKTTSDFQRGPDGNIKSVVQLEVSL